jgi:hypothetical protein
VFNSVLDDSFSSLFLSKLSVLHSIGGCLAVPLTPVNHISAMSLSQMGRSKVLRLEFNEEKVQYSPYVS